MKKKYLMPAICLAALTLARPDAVVGSVRNDLNTEQMLQKVNQKLDDVTSSIKSTAEDALKQAKQSGEVSAETKATADKLLTEQTALNKTVEELKNSLEGIKSQTLEISQQVAEGGGSGSTPVMTLGQAFVAQEDKIKAFASNGAKGSLLVDVSNAITTAAGSAGGLIYHEEERDPVRMPRRRLLIRDLLTAGRTSSDQVSYRKHVLRDNNAAMVAEGAAMPYPATAGRRQRLTSRRLPTTPTSQRKLWQMPITCKQKSTQSCVMGWIWKKKSKSLQGMGQVRTLRVC